MEIVDAKNLERAIARRQFVTGDDTAFKDLPVATQDELFRAAEEISAESVQ